MGSLNLFAILLILFPLLLTAWAVFLVVKYRQKNTYTSKGIAHLRQQAHQLYRQMVDLPQKFDASTTVFNKVKYDLQQTTPKDTARAVMLEWKIGQYFDEIELYLSPDISETKMKVLKRKMDKLKSLIQARKYLK